MAAGSRQADQPAVQAIVAASARCCSLSEWLAATLEAIEAHLDFRRSSLLVALSTDQRSAPRAFAGATHGPDIDVLTDYFEHWAAADPLASRLARGMFRARGFASTAELYPDLDPSQRRFVDEFLRSIGIADQLSLRLPGNGTTDGYLTIHEPELIGESKRSLLEKLATDLSKPLRAFLPRGLPGPLSQRERQAVELVAFGLTNREIAGVMNVGADTVKKHLFRATGKLEIRRRTELAVAWTTGRRLPAPLRQPPLPSPASSS